MTEFDPEKYIRESNKIEDVETEEAVEKSLQAWNYLKKQDELTHEVVKKTHQLIMEDRQPEIAGKYREQMVYVGDHIPPRPHLVKEKIGQWIGKSSPENREQVIDSHIEFETIHPFADGNGRVGRMLAWWQALQADIVPPFWTRENRQEYYQLFRKGRD